VPALGPRPSLTGAPRARPHGTGFSPMVGRRG
jgi:hypothetical protein